MAKSGNRYPFGYKPLEDGVYGINEPSATIVRRIYEDYLNEISMRQIAKNLNAEGIKSPAGVEWEHSCIKVILKNKRYCGNEIYGKIISEETFLKVQELKERGFEKTKYPISDEEVWQHRYAFTDIITCGQCGERYTRAVYCSGLPWQKRTWRCNGSLIKGEGKCRNTDIPEKDLKELFVKAFNEVLQNKDKYLKKEEENKATIKSNTSLSTLFKESVELLRNAAIAGATDLEYINRNAELILKKLQAALWKQVRFDEAYYNNKKLDCILSEFTCPLTEFKEEIFKRVVKDIIQTEPGVVEFHFINGAILTGSYETKAVMRRREENGKECSGNSSKNNPRG